MKVSNNARWLHCMPTVMPYRYYWWHCVPTVTLYNCRWFSQSLFFCITVLLLFTSTIMSLPVRHPFSWGFILPSCSYYTWIVFVLWIYHCFLIWPINMLTILDSHGLTLSEGDGGPTMTRNENNSSETDPTFMPVRPAWQTGTGLGWRGGEQDWEFRRYFTARIDQFVQDFRDKKVAKIKALYQILWVAQEADIDEQVRQAVIDNRILCDLWRKFTKKCRCHSPSNSSGSDDDSTTAKGEGESNKKKCLYQLQLPWYTVETNAQNHEVDKNWKKMREILRIL